MYYTPYNKCANVNAHLYMHINQPNGVPTLSSL